MKLSSCFFGNDFKTNCFLVQFSYVYGVMTVPLKTHVNACVSCFLSVLLRRQHYAVLSCRHPTLTVPQFSCCLSPSTCQHGDIMQVPV